MSVGRRRAQLAPGESKRITVTADPQLLARFEGKSGLGQWRIADGAYRVARARSASMPVLSAETRLTGRRFGQ